MQTIPEPDCVRIKREAQESIDRETAGMTPEERDAHVNRVAAEFAESLGFTRVSRPLGRAPEVTGPRQAGRRAG